MKNKPIINYKVFKLVLYFILAFLVFLFLIKNNDELMRKFGSGLGDQELVCMSLLDGGRLYKENMYCPKPPLFYLILYPFYYFFGMKGVSYFWSITVIAMHAFIVIITSSIISKKTNKDYFLLVLLIYSALIYNIGVLDWTIYSVFFSLLAFFMLYNTEVKYKTLLAGILFAIAIFIHVINLPFVLIVMFFYSFKIDNFEIKTILLFKSFRNLIPCIKRFLLIASPSIFAFILFKSIFPNFLIYSFLVHSKYFPDTLINTFYRLFILNISKLSFFTYNIYFIIALSLLFFIKKRDVYNSALFLGIVSVLVTTGRNLDFGLRYIYIYLALFIIVFLGWSAKIEYRLKKTLFISIIVLLIIPGLTRIIFDFERNRFRDLVEYPLHFIPKQKGIILAEGDEFGNVWMYREFLSKYYKYNLDNLDLAVTPYHYPSDLVPGFTYYFGEEKAKKWAEEWENHSAKILDNDRDRISKNMINHNYSLIIYGPQDSEHFAPSINLGLNYSNKSYYRVDVPFLYFFGYNESEQRLHITLLFRDYGEAILMRKNVAIYYAEKFDSICKKSKSAARLIYGIIMPSRGVKYNTTCISKNDFLIETYRKLDSIHRGFETK